ncbi:MAG: hypothetical protein HUU55_07835 [Myxococcales bacterium]|nr:hypothetical protein [Myxococcales bacterium]
MNWKSGAKRTASAPVILLIIVMGPTLLGCSDSGTSVNTNTTDNETDGTSGAGEDSFGNPFDGNSGNKSDMDIIDIAGTDSINTTDDGSDTDPGTVDIQPPADMALFQPDTPVPDLPPEAPKDAICCAKPDQETICPMLMARNRWSTPAPVALQFTLHWNPETVTFIRFQDEFCAGETCFPVDVPPSGLYPSGHSVGITPKDPDKWNGFFGVLVNTIAHPAPSIVDAWRDESAQLHGNPIFLEIVVAMPTPTQKPVPCILIQDLAASDSLGFGLKVELQDGILVVY